MTPFQCYHDGHCHKTMSVINVNETNMEKHVKVLFNPTILEEGLNRYGVLNESVHSLDDFESFIFNVHQHGEGKILRIGHDPRRFASDVLGEAAFVNYLASHGLSGPGFFLISRAVWHPHSLQKTNPVLLPHYSQKQKGIHPHAKNGSPSVLSEWASSLASCIT